MDLRKCILFVILIFSSISCSATPGDAAYRSGHFEQAANLYKKGAEQDDSSAALKLAFLIMQNKVSSETFGQAVTWFKRACALGDKAGCHNTGYAYEIGQFGANKDYNKARKFYIIAADKGYPQSQYNLGSLYSNQYFTDDIEGLKWMLIAKNTATKCSNIPICQWILKDEPGHTEKLMKRMNKNQIQKSQKQASGWKVKL